MTADTLKKAISLNDQIDALKAVMVAIHNEDFMTERDHIVPFDIIEMGKNAMKTEVKGRSDARQAEFDAL